MDRLELGSRWPGRSLPLVWRLTSYVQRDVTNNLSTTLPFFLFIFLASSPAFCIGCLIRDPFPSSLLRPASQSPNDITVIGNLSHQVGLYHFNPPHYPSHALAAHRHETNVSFCLYI